MLHVRLTVPAHLRRVVLDRLEQDGTVCNLAVFDGVTQQPDGDLVLFDVPPEAANGLIRDLKEVDLHRGGTIALHNIETTLSDTADRAEELAQGDPAEAVVWEQVAARIGLEGRLTVSFMAFLVVATLIGAIAVLTDSPVLVIGAMVVGPEFGPLAAVMLGVHTRRWRDAARAAWTLLVGFTFAGSVSLAGTVVLRAVGRIPPGYAVGELEFTQFISDPDLFSALVALLAGVAGVLSLTEDKAGTLVGVLISVTTIPALANIGVASALGDGREAGGAAIQLGVNVVCVFVAGIVTLTVQDRLLRGYGRVVTRGLTTIGLTPTAPSKRAERG